MFADLDGLVQSTLHSPKTERETQALLQEVWDLLKARELPFQGSLQDGLRRTGFAH